MIPLIYKKINIIYYFTPTKKLRIYLTDFDKFVVALPLSRNDSELALIFDGGGGGIEDGASMARP